MYRVLSEVDQPLKKDDILERMKARGKSIGKGTLEAYLSTDGRFTSFGAGFWGLVDRAYRRMRGGE